ncbi:MAG: aminodeoxychorismate synthase component I [Acidobacteriota bacterium]|nr:aminodeoxychorismate synthase component I [Acidobacteriota bacterium]
MKYRYPVPPVVYALVEKAPGTVLLETADRTAEHPLSHLFLSPLKIISVLSEEQIPALFARIESAISAGHVAAGYFAYECAAAFELKAFPSTFDSNTPLAWFGIYERAFRFDHATGEWLDGAPKALADFTVAVSESPDPTIKAALPLTRPAYREQIETIHECIRSGDIYQLNFTQSMRFARKDSIVALYAHLLASQPAAYAAFIHADADHRILSFSPELFFRVEDTDGTRRIITKPMKGTAPRGRNNAEDAYIADWLRNDEKNRSENVMIVDLLRNDLGRLCAYGSVQVDELFSVERLRTLWQMTSTVSGTLRRDTNYEQIFSALFPSGSVTGAPKVRAMQLISQLEPESRGVYTGAIGFFAPHQSVFNVAIRTLEFSGHEGRMGVGSGIVIDSDSRAEYDECLLKSTFLTQRNEPFQLIESLLWQDGYPFLASHLDRLADSAAYFGFAFDRGAIESALHEQTSQFNAPTLRKVRLLLEEFGATTITSQTISAAKASDPPLRVTISADRSNSRDPMYFHKTTCRPLYTRALRAAQQAGFDEALFMNERNEITEGTISNVFIEREGILLTPPVQCGLLAGVYRQHLFTTHTTIREQILTLEDVGKADTLYLANAVRGLRRAQLFR